MSAEKNEVSRHEASVYRALKDASRWLSNHEVAAIAKVAPRTARAHTQKLVRLGLLDVAEVFPGHRYRWSRMAEKRNAGYLLRLEQAAAMFHAETCWTKGESDDDTHAQERLQDQR